LIKGSLVVTLITILGFAALLQWYLQQRWLFTVFDFGLITSCY
jgi:hypothetical protein